MILPAVDLTRGHTQRNVLFGVLTRCTVCRARCTRTVWAIDLNNSSAQSVAAVRDRLRSSVMEQEGGLQIYLWSRRLQYSYCKDVRCLRGRGESDRERSSTIPYIAQDSLLNGPRPRQSLALPRASARSVIRDIRQKRQSCNVQGSSLR